MRFPCPIKTIQIKFNKVSTTTNITLTDKPQYSLIYKVIYRCHGLSKKKRSQQYERMGLMFGAAPTKANVLDIFNSQNAVAHLKPNLEIEIADYSKQLELNMKSLIPIVAASILTAIFVGNTYAADVQEKRQELTQESPKEMVKSGQQANKEMLQMSRASKIIGTRVKNPTGDNLGDIKDLVLDPQSGQISYAVISFGGVLGMGSKLFAIPWRLLMWDRNDEYYLLEIQKDILRKAPGFDKNHWPNSSDKWEQWSEEINQFYRVNPSTIRSPE